MRAEVGAARFQDSYAVRCDVAIEDEDCRDCVGRKATARGFEALRAEPNGFLVHHLNHSVTLSMSTSSPEEFDSNGLRAELRNGAGRSKPKARRFEQWDCRSCDW